jgi:hypothetical protein
VYLTSDGLDMLKERHILDNPIDLEEDEEEAEQTSQTTPVKPAKQASQNASPAKPNVSDFKASLPEDVRWILDWALKTDPQALKSLKVILIWMFLFMQTFIESMDKAKDSAMAEKERAILVLKAHTNIPAEPEVSKCPTFKYPEALGTLNVSIGILIV